MYKPHSVRDEKKALRRKFATQRQTIPESERLEKSRAICNNFLSSMAYEHSDTILLYYSINSEVDTQELIDTVLKSGKRLALPVCRENSEMVFRYIQSRDDLTKGFFSALEPKSNLEEFKGAKHTVCVIPAIAFDKEGYRIGYGKGYYDRFLKGISAKTAGFSYNFSLADNLPYEKTDVPLDYVITEKEVIKIKK